MALDDYTLDGCDRYMDEELDKMGSDYFPLEIKMLQFRKATYDFLRETTDFLEATQEISDDIKPLLVRTYFDMVQDPDVPSEWNVAEPSNYFRLIHLKPFYNDVDGMLVSKSKVIDIAKEGQLDAFRRDPYREPTNEYPIVTRFADLFKFHFGVADTTYTKALMTYIKHPTINNDVLTDRIVDLPNLSIEKIIDRTTNSLRFTTGDVDAMNNYNFDNTFGKKNR